MRPLNIAILGATGLVGKTLLKVLLTSNLRVNHLYLFASHKSAGKKLSFSNEVYEVQALSESIVDLPIDIAFLALDAELSKVYAPLLSNQGIYVIDNSSYFRNVNEIPLIVPEINAHTLNKDQYLISNPNCSTIQSVVPLSIIDELFGVKAVSYTTYQAVSGSGVLGVDDLKRGEKGLAPKFYSKPIYQNVIPQIDVWMDDGYTKEEMKMIWETQKILNFKMDVQATCVRVPVLNGHSVSMVVETKHSVDLEMLNEAFIAHEALRFFDQKNPPTPLDLNDTDLILIGRVRKDLNSDHKVLLWTVADNMRKGAATNAIQIAEYIVKEFI